MKPKVLYEGTNDNFKQGNFNKKEYCVKYDLIISNYSSEP